MADQDRSADPDYPLGPPGLPAPAKKSSGGNGLLLMRVIGLAMFAYGAVMLLLLFTSAKQWALEHSIAALVSRSDRRVGNTVVGVVDEPMAYAGSAVLMFAGLWFGLFVPWLLNRASKKRMEEYDRVHPE